ncbi:ABC-2 family transporter protein [Bifidobacterium goeldii]|uniref:ABC-2 family transporter protein n=1 Tax=Bifidobacterium goeldii TaxID=2306975 RepID=A0A430FEY8_9BIFI|nr:YhgE/Pip domain-containing protein [Bifidobacterium goeldii]RSX51370.1 ABC-2 family transporter protein [Bifidobacterium goeldii]
MTNVLTIVRRDLMRLLRVPTAWVIMIGLVMIPPLYAWFNIIGFWNPYGNTGNIRVAVANNDKGTSSAMLGDLQLGDQLVAELKKNDQLGWQFVSSAEAIRQVEAGESYAAIVIPKDFSDDMANVISGNGKRPQLEYYVNEKANAIAPKITDVGASTVDQQVNSAFVSTASKVISDAVNEASDKANAQTNQTTSNAIRTLDSTSAKLSKARTNIAQLTDTLNEIPNKTAQARTAIADASTLASKAGEGLAGLSSIIDSTQSALNGFAKLSSNALDKGSSLISQAIAKADTSIAGVSAGIDSANTTVADALTTLDQVNRDTATIIDLLNSLDNPPQALINRLQQRNQAVADSISRLTTLNNDAGKLAGSITDSASAMNTASSTSLTAANDARASLNADALPQLNSGLSSLVKATGSLGTAVSSQDLLISQTNATLDQLDKAAKSTASALKQTDKGLASLEPKLTALSDDLRALSGSSALSDLLGADGKLNASSIADFMLSPTVLRTKTLFPVNSYGSGMAPLFTSLSLWVGAFVLMVIVRLEVDDEGLNQPSATQRYWGRWLLLAILAAAQGLVCTIGDLIIGVQTVNAFAFVVTGVITSLVFLSITYALSTMFMHVGKAICIVLIIVQIPGGSGLYPIEMMPRFFRTLYPLFPFRYAINAFRETIGGFYDGHWVANIARLLAFAVVFSAVGLTTRPLLANLNRLFAREIEESDILVGEPVHMPGSQYRLSQAIRALADRDEYRRGIERRAKRFAVQYPRLKRGALIAGLVVPAMLAIVFALTPGVKLVALATWIVWILLIIGFLMTIELMRDSFERQVELGTLSDDTIRDLLYARGGTRGGMHAGTRARHHATLRQALAAGVSGYADDADDSDDSDDNTNNTSNSNSTEGRHAA